MRTLTRYVNMWIHTFIEYQRMRSVDPEGTRKAKDVTDNDNPHKVFDAIIT